MEFSEAFLQKRDEDLREGMQQVMQLGMKEVKKKCECECYAVKNPMDKSRGLNIDVLCLVHSIRTQIFLSFPSINPGALAREKC